MKLLHRTIIFMSGALLIALTIWAVIFYVNMLDEVHDSIDDGLDNSRLLIIRESKKDSTVFEQLHFEEGNYSIRDVRNQGELEPEDVFKDSLIFVKGKLYWEPSRLLTTTFFGENGHKYCLKIYLSLVNEGTADTDKSLHDSKLSIIRKSKKDPTVLEQLHFRQENYSIREIPNQANVFKDTLMFMENEHELEPVRLLTTTFTGDNGHNYQLKVISSMVEEDDLIEDLFYSLLWLYIILVVTIIAVNYLVLRSMWKPFFVFLKKIKEFKLGKNEKIDEVKSQITEFQLLNQVVLEVLENNVKSFHNQKQLIENTSHEIQTPLAIALNKLQLLAEQENLPENVVKEVYQSIETLQRLSRLNQSLQLLSKIENHQFAETETINLNELVKTILNDFDDQLQFKEIELAVDEKAVLNVKMHPDLAQILFSNLIKNAIRHNVKGGKMNVIFEGNYILVQNTGTETELDAALVFSRFYKQTTNSNSTGLGLAIIRSIAEVSEAEVSYSFDGLHQFQVRFPAERSKQ